MRLLVVSSWFPYPPDNGSKLRAFHLLNELARHHEVSLLSFCDSGQPAAEHLLDLRSCCKSVGVVPRAAFHEGPLGLRGLLSPVPRAYVQGFAPEMQAKVRTSLLGQDAAIALQITAALYLQDAVTVPAVFDEAEVAVIRERFAAEEHPVRRHRHGLTWWKYSRFVKRLCRRFEHTTVVSDAERALLEQIGCDPRRLSVVPNGVGASELSWHGIRGTDRLIYPGAMTYGPNYEAVWWFLATILPIIHRTRPDIAFWVTGSTDGVAVGQLPNANLATLTGHLADVRPAIASSTVCVVPLRVGGGTRLKILQAMALGTPVVATSKGAEGLAVTPERNILLGDTPEQFAAQVLRVLSDGALRERLSAEARRLVQEHYTWTRSGALLNSAVEQAVAAWKESRA
jgi:glycosyltransferase involved in cell wall biosynthesis